METTATIKEGKIILTSETDQKSVEADLAIVEKEMDAIREKEAIFKIQWKNLVDREVACQAEILRLKKILIDTGLLKVSKEPEDIIK